MSTSDPASASRKERLYDWKFTEVLIIDEVSMIDPVLFTKLSVIGKMIRGNNKPFGGIQLIVSGDFFQLPPVPNKHPVCMRCSERPPLSLHLALLLTLLRRTGAEPLEAIALADSRLPYEDPPRHLPHPKVLRCSDRWVNKQKELGCGFEWRDVTFPFETATWAECNFLVMELTKVRLGLAARQCSKLTLPIAGLPSRRSRVCQGPREVPSRSLR